MPMRNEEQKKKKKKKKKKLVKGRENIWHMRWTLYIFCI